MGSNPIGAWNLLLSYPCVALDGKLHVAFFYPLYDYTTKNILRMMRMMFYSVNETGILGKKSECSYQESKKIFHLIYFQRIYNYLETFPCLLVEHFHLGLLTWKDDARNWVIGNRETPYQLVEPYVPW